MFTPGFSSTALQTLPPDGFAWGCWIRGGYHFTYFYGAVDDYAVVAQRLGDGVMHKGTCATLGEARTASQERAAQLIEVYAGVGSARAVTASDCLRLVQADTDLGNRPVGRGS